jgi:hypothetical protein
MIFSVVSAWSQKVETKYDHGNDFRRYKSYAWRERKLLTQQSKENQQLIDHALVSAVDTQLQTRGLTEDKNTPDFYVTYDGASTVPEAKAAAAYSPYHLAGWGGDPNVWRTNAIASPTPNVWVSMEGVLLFEVIDAKTDSVTWSSLLRMKIKKPGRMPKDLDKAVAEIAQKAFHNFPPKAAGK